MEIGLRLLGAILKLVGMIMKPYFYMLSLTPHRKMPAILDEILEMSATKLAAKIRTGQLKSEQVVNTFINRLNEVNPYLNAIVEDRYALALEDARAVDRLIASRRKTVQQIEMETPLLGVPVTIKESCGLRGMSLQVGSLSRKGLTADRDGEAVQYIREAGAIPLAVTNTPELCFSWETHNLVTGKTLNPYDNNRTSGGSSGGEAALIAAGASVIGVASDIAGSIRIPAMYNGIFGHKPSPSAVSVDGHFPYLRDPNFKIYLGIGPLTRYAEDLRPMLRIMAGKNAPKLRLNEKVDLKTLRILYKEEAGISLMALNVEPEIKAAMQRAIIFFHKKHNIVAQNAVSILKEMEDSVEISSAVFFGLKDIPNLLDNPSNPKQPYNLYIELLKSTVGMSIFSRFALSFYLLMETNGFIPRYKYKDYCKQNEALRDKFIDLLKDDGVFFYPTHPTPAIYHNESFTKTAGVMYCMIFNVLGLPSTHVPLGLNMDGLPIGIQVIAAPNQDRLCLAVAEELEKEFGGWIPPQSA